MSERGKRSTERVSPESNGGGGGYRTPDPRLMSPLLYQLSYTATYEACTKCRSPRQGVHDATNKDSPAWRIPCLCAGYPLPCSVGYPLPVLVQRVLVMSR